MSLAASPCGRRLSNDFPMLRFGDAPKFGEHNRLSEAALPGDQHNAPRSPYSVGQRLGKILDNGLPANKNRRHFTGGWFEGIDYHDHTPTHNTYHLP